MKEAAVSDRFTKVVVYNSRRVITHTKADARVLLSHVVTLLIGKEHVS